MTRKTKDIFGLLTLPLVLLGTYLLVYLIWKIFNLPTDEALASGITRYFSQYGLWIVFAAALVEGFFVLGQYFPGGAIIFLGVISSGKNVTLATEVVVIVSLAFIISYTLNYLMGKYGWYKLLVKFGFERSIEAAKNKLTRRGLNAIFFSYWEPNLASMIATAAGILHIPLKKFEIYSVFGVLLWNTFWGVLVFQLGKAALKIMGFKYVLIIFLTWSAMILIKHYFSSIKSGKDGSEAIR